MPTARKLRRAVWLLLGVSALCFAFIFVMEPRGWTGMWPSAGLGVVLEFVRGAGVGCALAAGAIAVLAWIVSCSSPHEQNEESPQTTQPEETP